jgi:pimeloyl-ACP methyl ester carboxylesterase
MRTARRVGLTLGLPLAMAGAYLAICGYTALRITRPGRRPFARDPGELGLAYELVRFPSRVDRLPLEGWLLPAQAAGAPVIVVHGRANDRQGEAGGRVLEIAAALVGAGHPVLLFDLRGCGRSGGKRYTFGVEEARDVGGAIDFLAERGLADGGVNLLGFSMGAAAALLLAATEPRVRAVATDSGYATLVDLLAKQVPRITRLPRFFTPGTVWLARPLLGLHPAAIRPVAAVPALAEHGVPLLVIHGEADAVVPLDHGRRLAEAYGPSVRTRYVPGAVHVASFAADPEAYVATVLDFFAVAKANSAGTPGGRPS